MRKLSKEQIEKEIFDLRWKIESKQNLIDSGVITNDRTLRMTKRDIKRWKNQIQELIAKDENFDKPLKDVGLDQQYEDKQREADDIINDFENW